MLRITHVNGGDSKPLFELSGDLLRSLRPRGARRLAAVACSEPRAHQLGVRAPTKDLAVFLALRGPARRVVGAFDGHQYTGGLVAPTGKGIALLSSWPTTSRMLVYGDSEAAEELGALVTEWDRRGRPGEADVVLTVRFRNGRASIRTRWK
jgi:hypothetical protein